MPLPFLALEDALAQGWRPARKRRLLLAVYLDYLLFGAVVALAQWAVPGLDRAPAWSRFLLFLLAEAVLVGLVRDSPGARLLGLRLAQPQAYLASGQASLQAAVALVPESLLAREAWWTILFGVLAVLDGVKMAVRWTAGLPPAPWFGLALPAAGAAAVALTMGALEVLVGAGVLRLRRWAVPLGLAIFGAVLASALVGAEQLADWAAAAQAARRELQGVPLRPGEIEFARRFLPSGTVAASALALVWLLAIGVRIRRRGARDRS